MRTTSILSLIVCLLTTNLWGDEVDSPLIVLRFSEQTLNRSINEPVERKTAVNKVILETHVVGSAVTKGQPCLELLDDSNGATFKVRFEGTTDARTVGYHSPVVIYSRSQTKFTAEKTISLDQSGGFCRHPTKLKAQTTTTTENITTNRRFPLRRLVLRKAWQAVAEHKHEVNAIAKRDAQAEITAAFDAAVEVKLEKLQQQIALRRFVTAMLPGEASPAYRSVTSEGYFNVAVFAANPETKAVEVKLPDFQGSKDSTQIWLRRSLVGEQLDTALVNIDAMRQLISIPATLAAVITDQRLPAKNWQVVGEWYVVQLKSDTLSW